jgi:hypothetical protein
MRLFLICSICWALAGAGRGSAFADESEPRAAPKSQAAAQSVSIELAQSGRDVRFSIVGLSDAELDALDKRLTDLAAWAQVFFVTVAGESDSAALPMLGEYKIEDGRLWFTPRFPLRAATAYRATFRRTVGEKKQELVREFTTADVPVGEPTRVEQVFPTAAVLPENQLKFYIHFSAPMSRGEAYERIHLIDESGAEVEQPFLELGEELWNRVGTRFTLFFDPGRIKRGLKPREEVGPALEENKRYTLQIDQDWQDARGNPLTAPFVKEFAVVAPDDVQPRPELWRISAPGATTRAPLVIEFEEPLDRAMLERVLVVKDPAGQTVAGDIEVCDRETHWEFRPAQAWKAGSHEILIDATLEDLAGNSLARPFEVDVFRAAPQADEPDERVLRFEVRSVQN